MNPLISTLHLLLENRAIAYSKWPTREHEFLERQIMMGSIRVEQLPNGRRISILNNKLLLNELTKDKKNFSNNINFSLIDKIGSSIFYKKLNKNKVYKILQSI